MTFKQQFEWRLHVTSRWLMIVRARVNCLRARAPISWVVVAHSVPGCLNDQSFRLFARARESTVSGLALFMQVWSFALCTSCTCTVHPMVHAAFAGSLPARFNSWSRWSILWFQLSPVKPFCLKPSEAPQQSHLCYQPNGAAKNKWMKARWPQVVRLVLSASPDTLYVPLTQSQPPMPQRREETAQWGRPSVHGYLLPLPKILKQPHVLACLHVNAQLLQFFLSK